MMGAMTSPTGFVVCLDDVALTDLMGPVEVLIQEGFDTFSLPATAAAFAEVLGIFGARASFGAHGIFTADDVAAAGGAGAAFLIADVADDAVVEAAARQDLPLWLPGMTPTELRSIVSGPVAGAVVFPADIVGHGLAAHLKSHGYMDRLIPRGGVGAFSAGEWFKAGAPAVCIDETLLGDALRGGDLGQLRDRCGSFITVLKRKRR